MVLTDCQSRFIIECCEIWSSGQTGGSEGCQVHVLWQLQQSQVVELVQLLLKVLGIRVILMYNYLGHRRTDSCAIRRICLLMILTAIMMTNVKLKSIEAKYKIASLQKTSTTLISAGSASLPGLVVHLSNLPFWNFPFSHTIFTAITQCAAVNTYLEAIRVPPQKESAIDTATIQG